MRPNGKPKLALLRFRSIFVFVLCQASRGLQNQNNFVNSLLKNFGFVLPTFFGEQQHPLIIFPLEDGGGGSGGALDLGTPDRRVGTQ